MSILIYDHVVAGLPAVQNEVTTGSLSPVSSGAVASTIDNKTKWYSNRNLLRNAYFVGGGSQKGYGTFPINQRGGYVVPDEVTYYSDTALTTSAGTTSGYTSVTKVNSTYGSIDVSGTTYYVAMSDAVPGYVADGYAIDRFYLNNTRVYIEENYITVESKGSSGIFCQKFPNHDQLNGKQITVSILLAENADSDWHFRCQGGSKIVVIPQDTKLASATYTVGANVEDNYANQLFSVCNWNAGEKLKIVAAKLELGDTQTLAHQENGVWVLNEVPDYGEELRRCQEWYYRIAANAYDVFANGYIINSPNRASFIINFPVTMARTPTPVYSGEFGINSIQFGSATYKDTLANNTRANIYFTTSYNVPQGTGASLQDNGNGNAVIAFSAEP